MADTGELPRGLDPLLSRAGSKTFSGAEGDYIDLGHRADYAARGTTVALSFTPSSLPGDQALVSKDGRGDAEGDLTVWLRDGTIWVTLGKGEEGTHWLKVPDLVLAPGEKHHLAVSTGPEGLMVWLDGALAAAEPLAKATMMGNDHNFVVGASRAWREHQDEPAHSMFRGEIGDVYMFAGQIDAAEAAGLARAADMDIGMAAEYAQALADLLPAFGQMHHASDTLREIAHDFGYGDGGHGHGGGGMMGMGMGMGDMGDMGDMPMGPMLTITQGGGGADELRGTEANDGIDGGGGDDSIWGEGGDNVLQGGTGNDKLWGKNGRDILDGGEGEDTLIGGNGDDLLISRSDAREPEIAYDPDRDEGDPYNELTDGKLYPDQPIPGDDVMTGGAGADIFYIQTLINAKERYIEKHTNDDGTVNWHGVAGENDKLHDHWVDAIGLDVITDFSRAEGDRIVIEGHTTEIWDIRYDDVDGDGALDRSVIRLYSDQGGGGGAHNQDQLGELHVYGDLVKLSDIEQTAAPAYGIVATIDDLDVAITPEEVSEDTRAYRPDDDALAPGDESPRGMDAVVALNGTHDLTGMEGDYLDAGHQEAMALRNATISLSFTPDYLPGDQAIVSKDGHGDGAGDFTLWQRDGTLWMTLGLGEEGTKWLKVPDLVLVAGETHHVAVSMGGDGLMVWLDGVLAASEPLAKADLMANGHNFVVGASRAWRDDQRDEAHSEYRGEIRDVQVFAGQIDAAEAARLAGAADPAIGAAADHAAAMDDLMPVFGQMHHGSDALSMIAMDHGLGGMGMGHGMDPMMAMMMDAEGRELTIIQGTDGNDKIRGTEADEGIDGRGGNDDIRGEGGDNVMQGGTGNDKLQGKGGRDVLDGGEGEDTLVGGGGADLLISRSDSREPDVARVPDRDEGDPYNELTDGKLYPDQPAHGDDILTGGGGADVFYFQTLINAKERFIEKHTNDDGTVNWHGVAGENDNIHDHWVDGIGRDTITDYSRGDGDRIVIEGHTTKIWDIRYEDVNGDGIQDRSVIELYSDQGSGGGAHHMDRLGEIHVYGDLVKRSDIETTAAPAYGIVAAVDDLDVAIAPEEESSNTKNFRPKKKVLNKAGDLALEDGTKPVFAVVDSHDFAPMVTDYLVFDHARKMGVADGTVALAFTKAAEGWMALFSKDAEDYGPGGDLSAFVEEDGDLIVRFQTDEAAHYLRADGAIEVGQSYQMAFTFGAAGAELWLDGVRVAHDAAITHGLDTNRESLVIGATGWSNPRGEFERAGGDFTGTIESFALYEGQHGADALGHEPPARATLTLDGNAASYRYGMDSEGGLSFSKGGETFATTGATRFVAFADRTVRVEDIRMGSGGSETLEGGDGAEIFLGLGGDDKVFARLSEDLVDGGAGNDSIWGGGGSDDIEGGDGEDYVEGQEEDDRLSGGAGNDELKGGDGNDTLRGGWGDDYLYGESWGEAGRAGRDTVVYDGELADYTFEAQTFFHSTRGEEVTRLIVTDSPSGGADGFYEGRDTLMDIDRIVFADQTVSWDDLV